jgi:hypothetical protein
MPESGTSGSVRGASSNGRPYRDKEPGFQPNFSLSLRTTMDWPSEAEFCRDIAGNHGGHGGFPVLWPGQHPSFPQ